MDYVFSPLSLMKSLVHISLLIEMRIIISGCQTYIQIGSTHEKRRPFDSGACCLDPGVYAVVDCTWPVWQVDFHAFF
jgi:hypothetical protein